MRIGEMRESRYLKKEDVGQGKLVTITELEQQNVAMDDQPSEMKWIIHFREFDKGMVLNWTNIQLLSKAVGSEETADWLGKQVVVFDDPTVAYGGKLVGGIRIREVRKAKTTAKPMAAPIATLPPVPADYPESDDFEDDISF